MCVCELNVKMAKKKMFVGDYSLRVSLFALGLFLGVGEIELDVTCEIALVAIIKWSLLKIGNHLSLLFHFYDRLIIARILIKTEKM